MTDLILANLCLTAVAYFVLGKWALERRKQRRLPVPTMAQATGRANREFKRQMAHYEYDTKWPVVNGKRVPPAPAAAAPRKPVPYEFWPTVNGQRVNPNA